MTGLPKALCFVATLAAMVYLVVTGHTGWAVCLFILLLVMD